MQKLSFPGTDWRRLALIGAPQKPWKEGHQFCDAVCMYY